MGDSDSRLEQNFRPSGVLVIGEDSQMARRERDRKTRKIMDPNFRSKNMDLKVWGNLPSNLALEIYKRLPIQSYYRLREVCRDWNSVARERRCVTDPVHKPYFVLIHDGRFRYDQDMEDYSGLYRHIHGMLTFHIESGEWRWKKFHAIPFNDQKLLDKPFSVKGLTFSQFYPKRRRGYRIYDAHTRKNYRIPQQPELSKMSRALGMTVDTSVVPHSFKIIVGSLDIGTQIYDSVTKSWETRASLLVPCEESKFKSCLHHGDCLYIWSQDDKILVYSLETDKWSTLNAPSCENFYNLQLPPYPGLGSWDGRIFAVTCNDDVSSYHMHVYSTFRVWELDDQQEQKHWKFVDEMPSEVHSMSWNSSLKVVSSFCDELLMIYSWGPEAKEVGEFVLYNLACKKWEKVETPDLSFRIHSGTYHEVNEWSEWDDEAREDDGRRGHYLSSSEYYLPTRNFIEFGYGADGNYPAWEDDYE